MLYYTNKARETARDCIAILHRKLARTPLNSENGINFEDVQAIHAYLRILDEFLKNEIKNHPEQ